ncbi:MAG: aldehyde dehydrogenase family protein [Planctomycetota bacterium]
MAIDLDPDLRALQEVRDSVARAKRACEAIHRYNQAETDRLCAAMAKAAAGAAFDLARLAVEETGIGRVHYKVLKTLFGAEGGWESIRNEKTVGVIARDEKRGVIEVATAAGVVAGIVPTTNPTSTAIHKALIAVKGKNAIVISPHPRARRCIGEAVEVMRRAIERAGGPPDLVVALSNPTIESTGALMKHKDVALILATGGSGLVHAAYSSGKPAYGVGPGNVPCYIDRSADLANAARSITASQSFDNATLCCSEQALVLDRPIAGALVAELVKRGAHLCDEQEAKALARLCNTRGHMNADVVGLDPWKIAEMAGFAVPKHTTILLAHEKGVGEQFPLSIEILAPVLSLHTVDGWEDGCRVCMQMLEYGGLGHTLAIHAKDERVLEAFFLEKPANRILVNGPASQGAVGYSTNLVPSMSLGCGPQAGNITSDNITARHLINVKRVAFVRRDWHDIEARDHARAMTLTREGAPRGSGITGDPALGQSAAPSKRVSPTVDGASNWRGNPPALPRVESAASPRFTSSTADTARATTRGIETPAVAPGRASASGFAPSSPAPSSSRNVEVPAGFAAPFVTSSQTGMQALVASSLASAPRNTAAPAPIGRGPASAPTFTASAQIANTARSQAAVVSRPQASTHVGSSLSATDIQQLMSHAGSGCPLGPCKGCPHNEVTTGACMA